VLPVVQQETSRHRDSEGSYVRVCPDGLELRLAVDASSEGRKDVPLRVLYDVTGYLGDSATVQGTLGSELRLHFLFIEDEEARHEPQRAHCDEVFSTCLYAPYRGEGR
jgi:hypothetical protein